MPSFQPAGVNRLQGVALTEGKVRNLLTEKRAVAGYFLPDEFLYRRTGRYNGNDISSLVPAAARGMWYIVSR